MKKEDMNRLYNAGKAALKPVLSRPILLTGIKILVLVLIPISGFFPQTPINGFCKYNSIVTDSGFTGLFTTNFNRDSYTDIILFNPHKKEIVSLEGNQSGTFNKNKPYRTSVEISHLQNITDRNNHVTGFTYSSRKSMKTGIFEFLKDGRIRILKEIKFKSYPENISIADINGDGISEILVSGSAFDGLSVIEQKNNILSEKKITSMTSYSNALFADLSNDGFPDIASVNIYNNSIDFFYNNSAGSFKKVRSINNTDKILFFKTFDMNLDYYEDLVYSCSNTIILQYGDAISSYIKKQVINTSYSPDKIVTGDFNNDGRIDLVYTNTSQGLVSVIFGKDATAFYPEILYFRKNGLEDILPYYSKFISGIISLSSEGSLFTVSKLSSFSGEVNLCPVIKPTVITNFDSYNNGIIDLCYLDSFDSRIKLIVRNNDGIPYMYYSYPVYANHSSILVDNNNPVNKTFYCYSEGSRLIEAINIDINNGSYSRQTLYSPGVIEDLKIKRNDNNTMVCSAYIKNDKLGFSVFTYHDFRYTSSDYYNIADNVSGVSISFVSGPSVYYWQTNNNKVSLSRYSVENKGSKDIVEATLPGGKIKSVISVAGDLFNNENEVSFSFFKGEKNKYIIVSSAEMTKILNAQNLEENLDIPSKKDLYFGEIRFNGLKKLIVLNRYNKSVSKIDFINNGKNFINTKIADIEHVGSYFIKNMSYKKYHIAYTNRLENCITIKEI